jgi:hypothetical protein
VKRIPYSQPVIIAVSLAVAGGLALAAQDKYTVKVPNGLAFSEFKGYEDWPPIALSHSKELVAVIVGNSIMIDAYRAGIPGRRQDGEDPLDSEKERGGAWSTDGAGRPA